MTSSGPLSNQLLLTRWARLSIVLLFVGMSVALCAWGLVQGDKLTPYIQSNVIEASARDALIRILGAGGVVLLLGGMILAERRGTAVAETWTKRLLPFLPAGLLPFLLDYEAWLNRDITFLVLALLFVWLLGRTLSLWLESERHTFWVRVCHQLRLSRVRRRLARIPHLHLGIVLVAAAGYAVYFSWATIENHLNFGTSAYDLGIEHNLVWNTAHGGPLFRSAPLGGDMLHGGYHQTYFAFFIAPLYALVPRAETLLVIQSTFLAAAAIPLFLYARTKLGPTPATLLSCFFLLYAPMHGANLYDFHYQPFGVFFVLLIAYLFEKGSSWKTLLPLVLVTLSVREDVGALVGALGGYLLLSGKRPRDAVLLAAIGSAYFVAQKLYVMPQLFLDGRSSFAYMYKLLLPDGEEGFGGVLKTALGNPAYTLDTMLIPEKLSYVLQIFVPVALLPWRRSVALVLFLPAAVFTLLSTKYPALIMTSFQYTSYWTPMVFLACVLALHGLRAQGPLGRLRSSAWLVAVCAGICITSLRYGAVFQVEMARGAFDPVHLRPTPEGRKNLADFRKLAAKIPPQAKLVASEWLISHLANRRDAYTLRNGVLDAEYLIFWLHPTKFRADERPVLLDALVNHPSYEVVERSGMFVLARHNDKSPAPLDKSLRQDIQRAGTPRARTNF